jgi:deoxyribonuclease-4
MSIAGGIDKAPALAASVGCTAMQVFVKNNNRWEGPPISAASAARYADELAKAGIRPEAVIAHTCYLINLASPKEDVAAKSVVALADELARCAQVGIHGLVMHPGAHLGEGREAGIERIAARARPVLDALPDDAPVRLLLETTAGTGTNLGATFEDLRDILDAIDRPARTGVCLDTCHIFAAGFDIRTAEGWKSAARGFDKLVGLSNLRAIHLNDSKGALGSRKDRHAHIGEGEIGLEGFRAVLNDKRLRQVPMALETPKGPDLAEDRMNLAQLAGLLA